MSSPEQLPTESSRNRIEPDHPGPRAPLALRWLIVGIGASILLLVGLPIVMLVNRPGLVAVIERETDGALSQEWMARVVVFVMVYAIVLHLLDVILLVWLTPRVLRGRRWARITLTVYLGIATAGSLYSATMGGIFLWVAIPTDLLHLCMLVLLWAPPSVRRFFAAQPATHRTGAPEDTSP